MSGVFMFIRNGKRDGLKTACRKLHSLVKKNKKSVAAGFMLLLLAGIAYAGPRAVVDVANKAAAASKELPIYCVDREDKVVALTFDAAWAEGWVLE